MFGRIGTTAVNCSARKLAMDLSGEWTGVRNELHQTGLSVRLIRLDRAFGAGAFQDGRSLLNSVRRLLSRAPSFGLRISTTRCASASIPPGSRQTQIPGTYRD